MRFLFLVVVRLSDLLYSTHYHQSKSTHRSKYRSSFPAQNWI